MITTPANDPAIVRGDLVVTPVPDVDAATYVLSWDLRVGRGAVGPAGLATLRPGDSGLLASFDYQRSDRLLSVRVPFGVVEDAGWDGGDHATALMQRGRLDDADAEWLAVLLGPHLAHVLQTTSNPQITEVVPEPSSWPVAGRIALAMEHLRRTNRPLDGLWAAESAALVAQLDPGPRGRTWATALLDQARPALQLLDPGWARNGQGRRGVDDEVWGAVLSVLLRCHALAPGEDLGPLLDAMRELAAERSLDALAALDVDIDRSVELPELVHGGQLGAPPGAPPAQQVRVHLDHTVNGTALEGEVLDVEASAVAEQGVVRVEVLMHGPARSTALAERLMVRVTDDRGVLVAGVLSMRRESEDALSCELRLPPHLDPSQLSITLGRHLPVQPMTEEDHRRRQAAHRSRDVVDLLRQRRTVSAAHLHQAMSAWQALARDDLAQALQHDFAPPPFLAEALHVATDPSADGANGVPPIATLDVAALAQRGSDAMLAGARSLLWADAPAAAARLEAARLAGHEPDESLTVEQLEQLALAALKPARGDSDWESVRLLDLHALRVLYGPEVDEDLDTPDTASAEDDSGEVVPGQEASTSGVTIEAEAFYDPVPGADDDTYALVWYITVGDGPRSAGPAGMATLQRLDGIRAHFDYARASRLLALEVPFGIARDREVEGPLDHLLAQGTLAETDRAVLDALLGSELRQQLTAATVGRLQATVAASPHWVAAGRIAVAMTHRGRLAAPLDGLWAAEVAGLLWELTQDEPVHGWAREVLEDAIPSLQVLDPAWIDSASPAALARMQTVLLRCQELAGDLPLGSLLDALDDRMTREAEAAAGQLAAPAPQPVRVRGAVAAVAQADGVEVLADHTVLDWLDGLHADIDEAGHVSVRLTPMSTLVGTSVARRCTTQVLNPADQGLLGVALSLHPEGDKDLVVRIAVPAGARADQLRVLVGRDLPLHGHLGVRAFHARQAIFHSGRLVDVLRVSRAGDSAIRRSAHRAWSEAGRADLGEALERLEAQEPYLAESVPTTGLVDFRRVHDEADPLRLAGARSLAWTSNPATAAKLELKRHEIDPATWPLAPRHLEQLILAVAQTGDEELVRRLDLLLRETESVPRVLGRHPVELADGVMVEVDLLPTSRNTTIVTADRDTEQALPAALAQKLFGVGIEDDKRRQREIPSLGGAVETALHKLAMATLRERVSRCGVWALDALDAARELETLLGDVPGVRALASRYEEVTAATLSSLPQEVLDEGGTQLHDLLTPIATYLITDSPAPGSITAGLDDLLGSLTHTAAFSRLFHNRGELLDARHLDAPERVPVCPDVVLSGLVVRDAQATLVRMGDHLTVALPLAPVIAQPYAALNRLWDDLDRHAPDQLDLDLARYWLLRMETACAWVPPASHMATSQTSVGPSLSGHHEELVAFVAGGAKGPIPPIPRLPDVWVGARAWGSSADPYHVKMSPDIEGDRVSLVGTVPDVDATPALAMSPTRTGGTASVHLAIAFAHDTPVQSAQILLDLAGTEGLSGAGAPVQRPAIRAIAAEILRIVSADHPDHDRAHSMLTRLLSQHTVEEEDRRFSDHPAVRVTSGARLIHWIRAARDRLAVDIDLKLGSESRFKDLDSSHRRKILEQQAERATTLPRLDTLLPR